MIETITVGAGELAAAVKYVARLVPAKPKIPEHGGVLGLVDSDGLHLHGYGEDASGRATVPLDGIGQMLPFLVSGRLLNDVAQLLGTKDVRLERDDSTLTVRAGSYRATMPLMSDSDYPKLPDAAPLAALVDGDAFADAIRRVAVAAGRDVTLGAHWMGVHFEWSHDELILAACDRYRVARQVISWKPITQPPTIMVPAAVLVDAVAGFEGDEIKIGADEHAFSMSNATRSLTVPLFDFSQFPAAQIGPMVDMPRDSSVTFSVKAAQMPLKRVELLRNAATNAVVLNIRPGVIEFSASAGDNAESGDDEIAAEYDGDEASVILDSKRLHDALATCPGDDVTLSFVTGAPKPVLFSSLANPAWQHVVVPLRNV